MYAKVLVVFSILLIAVVSGMASSHSEFKKSKMGVPSHRLETCLKKKMGNLKAVSVQSGAACSH